MQLLLFYKNSVINKLHIFSPEVYYLWKTKKGLDHRKYILQA